MNRSHFQSTVYVVDDDSSIRDALKSMLVAAGYVVETFGRASEFLDRFRESQTGCLILDVRMPGMNGLELQEHLTEHNIQLPVIILTGHGDVPMAVRAMEAGAISFLEKPVDPDALLERIHTAIERDRRRFQNAAQTAETLAGLERLTPREREVMDLLIDGKKPRTISKALGITQSTIRVQRAAILKKMRADSVTDLLRMVQSAQQDDSSVQS